MQERLPLLLSELMAQDKPSLSFYTGILHMQAQHTCFKDYYEAAKDPTMQKSSAQISNTVSNWILKLEERIRRIL
jgi:hypothetical protein